MAFQIKELLPDDGVSPFGEWFRGLEGLAAAKVQVAVARMEQGNLGGVQWFRGIGEFRIDWGPADLPREGRREDPAAPGWRHQEAAAEGHRPGD